MNLRIELFTTSCWSRVSATITLISSQECLYFQLRYLNRGKLIWYKSTCIDNVSIVLKKTSLLYFYLTWKLCNFELFCRRLSKYQELRNLIEIYYYYSWKKFKIKMIKKEKWKQLQKIFSIYKYILIIRMHIYSAKIIRCCTFETIIFDWIKIYR